MVFMVHDSLWAFSYIFVLEQTESALAAGTTDWSSTDKSSLFKENITA